MKISIPRSTLIIVSILAIFSVGVGLLPLTYEHPEGTQLRDMGITLILFPIFLIGALNFITSLFRAITRRSFSFLVIAIMYLISGVLGYMAFQYSYHIMGYTMSD